MQFVIPPDCSSLPTPHRTVGQRVVSGIAAGDPLAIEELYALLLNRVKPRLDYALGEQESNDLLHETLTIVVESIRSGELRRPAALQAYLQTVVRRLIAGQIVRNIRSRERMVAFEHAGPIVASIQTPEAQLISQQEADLLSRGMTNLGDRDSELLKRFYIDEQPFRKICAEMRITETQFRLYKSRAKAKLAAWTRAQTDLAS